jgi:hypothetical protein
MTALAPLTTKQLRQFKPVIGPVPPSASSDSQAIASATTRAAYANYTLPTQHVLTPQLAAGSQTKPLEEQLYDARAACKIKASQFAMHFGADWQKRFFAQLDAIMSADDWDEHDRPVTESSFITLIRILLMLRGKRRPGLGVASRGNIVAAWTNGPNRLTIECQPDDRVRWVVALVVDEEPDTAAGQTTVSHLLDRLKSFNSEQWFTDEGPKPAT